GTVWLEGVRVDARRGGVLQGGGGGVGFLVGALPGRGTARCEGLALIRTRGGCSYGPEVDSVLWWEHRRIAGPPGCEGVGINSHPGRVLLQWGGCWCLPLISPDRPGGR